MVNICILYDFRYLICYIFTFPLIFTLSLLTGDPLSQLPINRTRRIDSNPTKMVQSRFVSVTIGVVEQSLIAMS
jgi:hypothetical protein